MSGGFAGRVRAAPRAHDQARGRAAKERLGASGPVGELLAGAAGSSPYLSDLIAREADWLADALAAGPEAAFAGLLADPPAEGLRDEGAALRQMKRRAALLVALADLGGLWALDEVTGALTDLADRAVARAFAAALSAETSGLLAGLTPEAAGLVVLFMGKGGARELNYSSDIDLILLHDPERFGADAAQELKPRWVRVAQRAVKLLTDATEGGYVFRVDLRLRPNPSVTPICLSVEAAERYYESMGRTWERAAFIKARASAGDIAAGERFLAEIAPFIWRRHLDFAALEDINSIRAMIRDQVGPQGPDDLPGFNLKKGPGGIREIEFFAQTQQLALGGRDPSLRLRGTEPALAALAAAGRIDAGTEAKMRAGYRAHRRLEHLLQMVHDAQTQEIPESAEAREVVAALGGWPDRAAMEAEVAARLREVRGLAESFFNRASGDAPKPAPAPEDVVASLPFARPEMVRDMAARWGSGELPCTRSQRAQRKFRVIAPEILRRLAEAGDPDDAALQFDRFLSGLPAGVQLFSLFEANPPLLDLIAEICAAAPRLAVYLGRNSGVLDAVLDADFFEPLPDRAALSGDLAAALSGAADYEAVLDLVRVWAKDFRFRLGVQVLRGVADEAEAGRGFSDIAEACLDALLPAATAEFARRHGPPPGAGAAVIGMGKLGGREMTAASDLDLIVVYDAAGMEASEGPKPLSVGAYYARLTQALVSALTAQTAEGPLYETDMRLRPSGGQGPVAVSLESFRRYHETEAWTWERMALTRARAVVGPDDLRAGIDAIAERILRQKRDPAETRADVAAMRARLVEAKRAERGALWSLKHGAGGIMDIEFAAQCGLLEASIAGARSAPEAFAALRAAGALREADAAVLTEAHRLQSRLLHVERVAIAGMTRPEAAGRGLRAVLARAGEAKDFGALEARLAGTKREALAIVDRLLAPA